MLTVHAANQLDGEYRAKLLKFLYKQNLIGGQCKVNPLTALPSDCKPEIVELKDINLENAALEDAAKSSSAQNFLSLKGANLSGVSLVGAELPNTNLSGSTIKEVDMESAVAGCTSKRCPYGRGSAAKMLTWLTQNYQEHI